MDLRKTCRTIDNVQLLDVGWSRFSGDIQNTGPLLLVVSQATGRKRTASNATQNAKTITAMTIAYRSATTVFQSTHLDATRIKLKIKTNKKKLAGIIKQFPWQTYTHGHIQTYIDMGL